MQKHLKTILTFFCLLCTLLILTPAARAQETGEQNRSQKVLSSFPEKTVFMTVIPNAPDLKKKITSHRLADAVKNQEVRAFLRPLLEKKNLQNWLKSVRTVTGHSLDQLTDLVTGPVAAGLLDGKKGMFSEGSDQGPAAKVQGLLIARVDGHESTLSDEIIPALVEKWKKKLRKKGDKELFEKTEPMGDTTLHTFLHRKTGPPAETANRRRRSHGRSPAGTAWPSAQRAKHF